MTRYLSATLVLCSVLLLGSCSRKTEDRHPTIQYVKDILADRDSREMGLLRHGGELRPADDIAIVGSFSSCDRLAGLFYSYDVHDNVDGSHRPDGLPDFAGETFSLIASDAPYSLDSAGIENLRRSTVMLALGAIDTVSHISPYDLDGLGDKRSSKLIVLADAHLAQYGQFDVDTLFRSAGCKVVLASPLDLMLRKVFESCPGRPVRIGILCNSGNMGTSVYSGRFREIASGYPRTGGSECLVLSTEKRDSLLRRMVGSYMDTGNTRPFDAVLVDDLSIDVDAVKGEFADMVSVLNESSMTYGRMFSENFCIFDSFSTLADFCYGTMRRQNLFTHNISFPQAVVYRPVPKPDSEDGQIILISGFYVQD